VVEVRRTFLSQIDACLWEKKVLTRLGVVTSDMWLNLHIPGGQFVFRGGKPQTKEHKARRCLFKPGKDNVSHRPEVRSKIGNRTPRSNEWRENHRKRMIENNSMLGRRHSEESIQKMKTNRRRGVCPYCHRELYLTAIKRWHGDKCKERGV
jgi:hypothetical protein